MKSKYTRPADTPAHACGRCLWWKQTDPEGWGLCRIWNDKYWHKCMTCEQYEYEPEEVNQA